MDSDGEIAGRFEERCYVSRHSHRPVHDVQTTHGLHVRHNGTLFAYLQSQVGDRVEICIGEDDYVEIELNSRKIRLGKFILKDIALPLFLSILGGYIANQCNRPAVPEPVIEVQEFQKPVEVEFSITVEDSTGRRKEFQYDGSAADYKDVSDEILKLWNE